jgi:molecular chaperone DnaK
MAVDNKSIGRFNLSDIPPAPRGMPKIEVTFDIDANGILNVSAKDLGTGKEQKITITSNSGLSQEEIERMRQDAEKHADEDANNRKLVEVRNEADSSLYRSEKLVKEKTDTISEEDRKTIEAACEALREALKGDDSDAIQSATEKLNEAWQPISAKLYQEAQQAAEAAAGAEGQGESGGAESSSSGSGKSKDEDVIDAEVVDEDDKKA